MKLFIIVLCTMGLGIASGCQSVNPKLAEGIREGQKQYGMQNYLGAERLLTAAISMDPTSPAVAEAYYIRGLARLKLLQHNVAKQDFERAINLTDREDLKSKAHVCLGSIAYESEDWNIAYKHYKAAENQLPLLSPSDWVMYRLASSAQRSGRWEEGKIFFARILREFPGSETAMSARRNLNYDYFTIQVGAFANPQGAYTKVETMKKAGFNARIYPIQVDGRSLRGVCIGQYRDYYQASQGLVKVKSVVPEARIVP